MRHWHGRRGLLRCTVLKVLVCSLALVGCANNSADHARVSGTVSLSAGNAAAIGGLTFAFADAALFGFPGESANLTLDPDGTTFTLTRSGGTVLQGSITYGSCQLTQHAASLGVGEAPLVAEYDTCEVTGLSAGDIAFGGSGTGTITLRLGRAGAAPVDSAPTNVIYHIDLAGSITINETLTPIGVVG